MDVSTFQSLNSGIGVFNAENKVFLIPQMNGTGAYLLAAALRSFGIQAKALDTYNALDLGKEYTSGKECLPCLITTGDILKFLNDEREKQGPQFKPDNYIFFMPESDGPCRFGMYNKYQRIVLDSFPEFRSVKIGSLTSRDGYSLDGLVGGDRVRSLRKAAYLSVLIADIINRLVWRVRPYEREEGETDRFICQAVNAMEEAFEIHGTHSDFKAILHLLDETVKRAKKIPDPSMEQKPLVGIVGEIFLRVHDQANQELIRTLERYGAEVVNASLIEWINYTSYNRMRDAKIRFRLDLKQFRICDVKEDLKDILNHAAIFFYQQYKQRRIYKRVRKNLRIAEDHKVAHLERILKRDDVFSFDIGTEACLSISGIMAYTENGYNGVVNVYPFTCMPSSITSSIAKPLMDRRGVPYLDVPCDASQQPGRETDIRTFMYQVYQHFRRNR